jgi:hypothetical protein
MKKDVDPELKDTKDRYGRERQMVIEHHHANRAQRRAMRGRSYVPAAHNKPYEKGA